MGHWPGAPPARTREATRDHGGVQIVPRSVCHTNEAAVITSVRVRTEHGSAIKPSGGFTDAGHHDEWHHEGEWAHHGAGAGAPAGGPELHEAHTGFLSVARLLSDQGIWHPAGEPALASQLATFFEERMVRLVVCGRAGTARVWGTATA